MRMRAQAPRGRGGRPSSSTKTAVLLAALFAAAFYSVPWEMVKRAPFTDLLRYVDNFYGGVYLVDTTGTLGLWLSEGLWQHTVWGLAEYVGGIEGALRVLSAISLVFMVFGATVQSRSAAYLAVLVSPLFVDLVFSQVRSAFAFSILYLVPLVPRRLWGFAVGASLVVVAVFVHQFAVVVVVLAAAWVAVRWLPISWATRLVLLVLPLVASLLALTVLREPILAALEDRRANAFVEDSGGLMRALMVFSFSVPVLLRPRSITTDHNAYLVLVASVLYMGLFMSGVGGGVRLMGLALPALVVVVARIRERENRRLFYGYVLCCNAMYFTYWIREG
jgi:hypothetical protein